MQVLLGAAATAGFVHTLLGPDHYLPFIMIAWARKWSRTKTAVVTFLCGVGHILSSIVLGAVGVALGVVVSRLEAVESARGDVAAWLLIAFGLAYTVWGIRRAYKNRPHVHPHLHPDGHEHLHEHSHSDEHSHIHADHVPVSITPWALFIIFVFGPCEVLIPFLMYPAARDVGVGGLVAVTAVFAATTIATMMAIVLLGLTGINFVQIKKVQRFAHLIAGATILACGLAMRFLGL